MVAHGADGSTFTLDFPPDSLDGLRTITMTPVSRIERIPYTGGLIAGVELEPDGLRLGVPATLTIEPATPAPPNSTVPFEYARAGENLINALRLLDTSAMAIPIFHFSGYGAGQGSPGDNSHTPANPLERYTAEYAYSLSLFVWQQITREQLNERVESTFSHGPSTEQSSRSSRRPANRATRLRSRLRRTRLSSSYVCCRCMAWREDLRTQHITPATVQLVIDVLQRCGQKAYDRCVRLNDPFEAALLLYVGRTLQLLGVQNPSS